MVFVLALTENCFLARNDIGHILPNQETDVEAFPAPYGNTGCSGKVRKFIFRDKYVFASAVQTLEIW